jgi:hypothetical protein
MGLAVIWETSLQIQVPQFFRVAIPFLSTYPKATKQFVYINRVYYIYLKVEASSMHIGRQKK